MYFLPPLSKPLAELTSGQSAIPLLLIIAADGMQQGAEGPIEHTQRMRYRAGDRGWTETGGFSFLVAAKHLLQQRFSSFLALRPTF